VPQPLISVVMPVYNGRAHLADAIASIRAQTHDRWELIVVDDGSDDGSAALAAELASGDERIRVLEVEHSGAAGAVNAGADVARGELIARMDGDDIAVPERFAVQLQWMRRTGVEVCGSCAMRFGAETGVLWFPETHDGIAREMLFRHGLLQPTVLMATDVFLAHRYREGARFEGNELWIRLRRHHRLGNVPATLVRHRCHAAQTRVVRAAELRAFVRASRVPLFHELYPEAGELDAQAIDRVADREPCVNLAELERVGGWLTRLADGPDVELRRRMRDRWRAACRGAAPLGLGAYRLHQRFAPQFGLREAEPDASLLAVCAARLEPDALIARGGRRLLAARRERSAAT
jgi:glycosyltransferase involved in cell wall biosynthesis